MLLSNSGNESELLTRNTEEPDKLLKLRFVSILLSFRPFTQTGTG